MGGWLFEDHGLLDADGKDAETEWLVTIKSLQKRLYMITLASFEN